MRKFTPILLLALAGCATTPVVQYRDVTVLVPEPVSCIPEGSEPTEVAPLKDRIPRDTWNSMSTDQRAAAIASNGVKRVIYENETEIVLVACRDVRNTEKN